MRVFLTGATGFLGRHLVPLLLERGDEVRALVRPGTNAGMLEARGVGVVRGELEVDAIRRAADGCELAFHLAGIVSHQPRDLDRLRAVNVEGVRLALEGVSADARFVHVSSVAAIGPNPGPGQPGDETQPFPEWAMRLPYAATKRNGEAVALAAARDGRDVVVANPGFLIGPGDVYGVSTWHVRRYLQGFIRTHVPGGLSNVDARDVAAGLVQLADKGRAGERHILTNREGNLSHAEFFRRVGEATGVKRHMLSVPQAVGRRLPVAPWPLHAGEVRAASHWWFYDPAKAERELGFTVRPIDETIAATAAQYL